VRKIKDLPAFYVTALFSVLAYLWLVVILSLISKDMVEIWEAAFTFALSPVLIYVSYKVDAGEADAILSKLKLLEPPEEEVETVVDSKGSAKIAFTILDHNEILQERDILQVDGIIDELQTLDIVATLLGKSASTGPVTCTYRTECFTAVPDYDYLEVSGELEFTDECTEQHIELEILPMCPRKGIRNFLLILEEADGAGFNPDDDGGDDSAILTVTFGEPGGYARQCNRRKRFLWVLDSCLPWGIDFFKRAMRAWPHKCVEAVYCNGSPEDQKEASWKDWIFHILTLPWKLLFVSVPPTHFFGGWACFLGSLLGIAFLCALLSDLAEMFGCVLEIPEMVTAISFVALGTSMPDLFASLSAAKEDPTADAAIVNVTGSNSVNVFLGLGLPWTIGTIYWAAVGRTKEWEERYPEIAARIDGVAFVANSSNLPFSVIVFLAGCIVALFLLHLRRRHVGGELGGAFGPKIATFVCFIGFWLIFIFFISYRVLRIDRWSVAEMVIVIATTIVLMVLLTVLPVTVLYIHQRRLDAADEEHQWAWTRERAAECDGIGMCSLTFLRIWLIALVLLLWIGSPDASTGFWLVSSSGVVAIGVVAYYGGKMRVLRLLGNWSEGRLS